MRDWHAICDIQVKLIEAHVVGAAEGRLPIVLFIRSTELFA